MEQSNRVKVLQKQGSVEKTQVVPSRIVVVNEPPEFSFFIRPSSCCFAVPVGEGAFWQHVRLYQRG